MRMYFFNFLAALGQYWRMPAWLDTWVERGCVRHTPHDHHLWDEPMF